MGIPVEMLPSKMASHGRRWMPWRIWGMRFKSRLGSHARSLAKDRLSGEIPRAACCGEVQTRAGTGAHWVSEFPLLFPLKLDKPVVTIPNLSHVSVGK